MIPDAFLEQTAFRFPNFQRDHIQIEPLEKGGSDRKYYRIALKADASLILVKYGSQREENRHYCEIATFLSSLNIRVPAIFHHDEAEHLIWMEDLGTQDLWHFRAEPWSTRQALYRSALEQAVMLHTANNSETSGPQFQKAFDADLYLWEQSYFFENCAERVFKSPAAALTSPAEQALLCDVAHTLASLPRSLVHRDLQSQNIMVHNAQAYLIDFQGMRPGLPHYDLASLLFDPYVSLTHEERNSLLDDYILICSEAGYAVPANFRSIFPLCALQRLMQALGAYGFLGIVRERPHFLSHIPTALTSLREVVSQIKGLENFHSRLATLQS
jgi:aminoglycoside/choline kinase family phosphotransferase